MQNLKRIDIETLEPFEAQVTIPPRAGPSLGLADGATAEISSPALALQQRLLDQLNAEAEADADDGRRWSPRATMLFCGAASLGVWGVIALAVAAFR